MNTGFRSLHPITSLLFYILIFSLSLTATHPAVLISIFICGAAYNIKCSGAKALRLVIKLILPMIIISGLINGLFSHFGVTVLFTLPDKNVFTLEAVVYGIFSAFRAGCMLIWLISFNEVLTGDKIIFLFGRVSPKLALIISMALRFIPLVLHQSEEISLAAKGLGNSDTGSFIKRISNASKRLSILVSWSLERGTDTLNSMNARGYGLKGRSTYDPYVFSFKDICAVFLAASAAGAVILSKSSLKAIYNPEIIVPFPGISGLITIFFILAFLLFPLLFDIREERKWSISA